MPVSISGSLNLASLVVPDVYINVVPPQVQQLNGVPTNIAGLVGVASWGPKNSPQIIGGNGDGQALYGKINNRPYDLSTAIDIAVQQGSNNFRPVRVTDGSDTAAAVVISQKSVLTVTVGTPGSGYTTAPSVTFSAPQTAGGITATGVAVLSGATVASVTITNPGTGYTSAPTIAFAGGSGTGAAATATIGSGTNVTATSLWTGTAANGDVVAISNGSKVGSWKVTLSRTSMAGLLPEVFDNIGFGLTGAAVWAAIANAVNNGIASIRGPSKLMRFAVPGSSPGADTPVPATYSLTGGTDGAATITTSTLLGIDGLPGARTGMYALRGTQASVCGIPELADSTAWTTINAFAQSEGMYWIACGPSSDSVSTEIASKAAAGLDSPSMKLMFGDWPYYLDTTNGVTRMVSPVAYVVGLLANLSPEQSSLNKQLNAVVGTQQSMGGFPYGSADLQALMGAGIDVIANPCPGGAYFGCRLGPNTSSNAAIHGDNYPRMTNFIAYTLNGGMGKFVGKVNIPNLGETAKATLDDFLQLLADEEMVEAFSVVLDASNNPPNQVSSGYLQANCQVRYLSIVEKFIVNLQGGQTVQVQSPLGTISS